MAKELTSVDGELWQGRTWFNPDDASVWDSFEDIGAANQLIQERLWIDERGLLWRQRFWADEPTGATWLTQEDLGDYNQAQATY